MKKQTLAVVAIIIGILLIVLIFFMVNRDNNNTGDTGNTGTTGESEGERGTVITYTDEGFSPSVLIVDAGQTITIENESSRDLQFSSDQHPTHTQNEELNAEILPPGETQTLRLDERGTWGYHDHLNPGETGEVIVE
jgi:plastocyanin